MYTATRFPLERIAAIDRAVRSGEYPNAGTIADRLEVSKRTIQRDIEYMKDRMSAPLLFDPKRQGYAYTDASFRLPEVSITEGELLALVVAERILRQFRGTPYAPDLERAFRKIVDGLTDPVTVDLGQLADSFSFRTTAPDEFDPDVFLALQAARRDRRRVVLTYWTASRDEESQREVDPYHLDCTDGHWYLVGYCHTRREVLTFALSRVRAMTLTGATFDVPEDFRIDEYFAQSFGVFRGDGETYRVRLRFTGEAARYVRERKWHHSQVLEPAADGYLVGFELGHLREVERWALSWGADCEVLEPQALRESVSAALSLAAGRYSPPAVAARAASKRRGPSPR